jgi:hypothetical protein
MPVVCPKNYGSCGVDIKYESNRIFVLMPFSEDVVPQNLFFNVLQSLPGWNVHRADSDLSKPDIWCKICANIQSSRAIIADLSGSNPNVFLELGLTWGFGKQFILLTQDHKTLPFDTKSFQVIKYSRSGSEVLDSTLIQNSVLRALNALPQPIPTWNSESPEAYLEEQIRDAKRRTVELWRRTNDGWKIIAEQGFRRIDGVGFSLLKDYPQPKTIDQICFETDSNKKTVQALLYSKAHGFSNYFEVENGLVRLTNEGIYWLLEDILRER